MTTTITMATAMIIIPTITDSTAITAIDKDTYTTHSESSIALDKAIGKNNSNNNKNDSQ